MEPILKHAYLIMAHNQFEMLKALLEDLDDENNDIFLHVDLKTGNYQEDTIRQWLKHAKIYFLQRQVINWGGFSQIDCILRLLQYATSTGLHTYYHFMVGTEFPLKSQKYIHKFFADNNGYEFIGYDIEDSSFRERILYFHIFNEYGRNATLSGKIKNHLRKLFFRSQKVFRYQYIKNYDFVLKKGNANWSITHSLACYIVSNSMLLRKLYAHSYCGDEVFIHTLVYNSQFYERVYDIKDEYRSCMRLSQWNSPDNVFHTEDLPLLMKSDRLFARKFCGVEGLEIVKKIKQSRNNISIDPSDLGYMNDQKDCNNKDVVEKEY